MIVDAVPAKCGQVKAMEKLAVRISAVLVVCVGIVLLVLYRSGADETLSESNDIAQFDRQQLASISSGTQRAGPRGPHAHHPISLDEVERAVRTRNTPPDREIVRHTWTASDEHLAELAKSPNVGLAIGAVKEAVARRRPSVLPVLRAGLSKTVDKDLAVATIDALTIWRSKNPEQQGLDEIAKIGLDHPDELVKQDAAVLLAQYGDRTVLILLIDVLKERMDPKVALAANSIAQLYHGSFVAEVSDAYHRIQRVAKSKSDHLVYSQEQRTADSLLLTLGSLRDAEALRLLAESVDKNGAYPGRPGPIFVLIHVHGFEIESARLARLLERDLNSRLAAIEAIGRLGDPRGAELVETARKSGFKVVGSAVWANTIDTYMAFVAAECAAGRKVEKSPHEWIRWKRAGQSG